MARSSRSRRLARLRRSGPARLPRASRSRTPFIAALFALFFVSAYAFSVAAPRASFTGFAVADRFGVTVVSSRLVPSSGGTLVLGSVANQNPVPVGAVGVTATVAEQGFSASAGGGTIPAVIGPGGQAAFRIFLPGVSEPQGATFSVAATAPVPVPAASLVLQSVRDYKTLDGTPHVQGYVKNTGNAAVQDVRVGGAFFDADGLAAVGVAIVPGTLAPGAVALFDLVPVGATAGIERRALTVEALR